MLPEMERAVKQLGIRVANLPASGPYNGYIRPHGAGRANGAAGQQDVLGQRAVDRNREARDLIGMMQETRHQTSAPPPNEKNDRKKLDAANAMLRPKTIWISRRKPPEVSPNASVKPVTMMMMTAMILATGPSIDSRID